MRILIIEDSFQLADTLTTALEKERYEVDIANDGRTGYDCALSGIHDLIILDLMLPSMSGYDILQRLRKKGNHTPILVLSAKSELEDKVAAFEQGCDDYLTKPFEFPELLMRIKAITRRKGDIEDSTLFCGNLQLNLGSFEISNTSTQQSVKLGRKEFQMLEYLLRNQNYIITKEQLIEKIWGFDDTSEYNNAEVYISFLRKKINFVQCDAHIRTVRGIGYTLEVPQ